MKNEEEMKEIEDDQNESKMKDKKQQKRDQHEKGKR